MNIIVARARILFDRQLYSTNIKISNSRIDKFRLPVGRLKLVGFPEDFFLAINTPYGLRYLRQSD